MKFNRLIFLLAALFLCSCSNKRKLDNDYLDKENLQMIEEINSIAKDTFNVRVVKALAPAGTKVIVYNVEKAAEKLMVQGVPGERLLLLAKTPTTYNRLIKAGVPLKEVNLGGAGIRGERQPFINNVALNPEEVLACEEMQKAGVNVYYQLVPEQSVVKIDDALKKAKDNFGL